MTGSNFPHKLLLIDRQNVPLRKAFANFAELLQNLSAIMKL